MERSVGPPGTFDKTGTEGISFPLVEKSPGVDIDVAGVCGPLRRDDPVNG